MSITNYTQNFITFLSNHKFTTETTKTIFDPVSEDKMGKYLRFTDDNGDINILSFDHDIRESKDEERVNNRECLADYVYKGKDFARNVLIDNGFFVLDEKVYSELKSRWGFFKYRIYNPVHLNDGSIGYFDKDTFYKNLNNIENTMSSNPQAINASKNWRYKLRTVKENNDDFFTTYHETYENNGDFYYRPKRYSFYDASGYIGALFLLEIICFICMFIMNSDYSLTEVFQLLIFFIVPFGLLLFFIVMHEKEKKDNEKEQRKSEESKKVIDDLMNECYKKSQQLINSFEEELKKVMKETAEKNIDGVISFNYLSGKPDFNFDKYNVIFNLLMHCGYPYTFSNGEIFNSVYTVSSQNYILSIDKGFQMIDDYLEFCEQFVYPMIRAYGRKQNIDLRDLNKYIIQERRVDMRHKEICAKLDRIYYGLQQLHKDNLAILDSLDRISSDLSSIANYQAITSAQLASIERKL